MDDIKRVVELLDVEMVYCDDGGGVSFIKDHGSYIEEDYFETLEQCKRYCSNFQY